jgi:hypothetical protein
VAADGTPLTDAGMVVFELILAGVNAQELFQPTLKHTQYVSSSYAVQTSYENVSKILASSTVAALLPQNIAFILPPDPQFGMIGFAYGWYKDLPQVTGAAFSKTQIVTNYEFGLWNVAQYNTPI